MELPGKLTANDENGGALESGKGSPSGRKMEANAERRGYFVGKRERVSVLQPRRCKRRTSKKAS